MAHLRAGASGLVAFDFAQGERVTSKDEDFARMRRAWGTGRLPFRQEVADLTAANEDCYELVQYQ